MEKVCRASGKTFTVSESLQAFLRQHDLPIPDLCPQEQWRRQIAWKNERCLYRRKCDGTGKSIISVYSSDKPFTVYEPGHWWSDAWDPLSYGREIDFSRPFFEQFNELNLAVPKLSLDTFENQNCNFTNLTNWDKDCYLLFEADQCQNAYYTTYASRCQDIVDCHHVYDSQKLYECVNCELCYDSQHLQDCSGCRDSYWLKNCTGCSDCFGCVNLKSKEYHWLNQPLDKLEYHKRLSQLKTSSRTARAKLQTEFFRHQLAFPEPSIFGHSHTDSTGNYLRNTQNCGNCFNTEESVDCQNVVQGHQAQDCYNCVSPILGVHTVYNCYGVGAEASLAFCSWAVGKNSSNLYYSWWCIDNCQNLFGCVSLRQAQNCILNKSYTKHEYEQLFEQLKNHMKETGEWGQFFPLKIAPYAYNETVAHAWWPWSKAEVLKRGLKWKKSEDQAMYQADFYHPPDTLNKGNSDLSQKILACQNCQKNYRLIKPEIEFYQEHNVPIPAQCFECRQTAREALMNPRELHNRTCERCRKSIQTTFAPDRPEIVWCEECYLNQAVQ